MLPQLLIIFVRYPRIGHVKTRMTRACSSSHPLHPRDALELYVSFLKDLLPRFQSAKEFDMLVRLGGANDQESKEFREKYLLNSGQLETMPPGINDLGALMEHCFEASAQKGYKRTVLIGSDVPQLSKERVNNAFEFLKSSDMIIGPDNDGGMYLLGYSHPLGLLKEGIVWGQGTDKEALVRRCLHRNVSYRLLPEEIDMDCSDDLSEWMALLSRNPQKMASQKRECPHTIGCIENIENRRDSAGI
ncbi:MAG: glycosyltransferase [SAR324 cluster bacterium]|nr:glycosyltransferase [SAR324 cluster bacterium]